MPDVGDDPSGHETLGPGVVGVEVKFDAYPTAEVFTSLLEALAWLHESLVEQSGLYPVPLYVPEVKHPNSLILLASDFLLTHRGAFAAVVPSALTLAKSFLDWRKSVQEKKRAEIDKKRSEIERETAREQGKQEALVEASRAIEMMMPPVIDERVVHAVKQAVYDVMRITGYDLIRLNAANPNPPPGLFAAATYEQIRDNLPPDVEAALFELVRQNLPPDLEAEGLAAMEAMGISKIRVAGVARSRQMSLGRK
jgi:hypothetical protein